MVNLTTPPNHRQWDESVKTLAWHEYFRNSVQGKGIYRILPCEKTVNTFFEMKIDQYHSALTNISYLDVFLDDYIKNATKNGIISDGPDFSITCTLGLDAYKIASTSNGSNEDGDGHVHDLEMNKILLLLGKLQSFRFCETGLTSYHTEYFKKFIEPSIDSILNSELSIEELIQSIFIKFPDCPPMPLLDVLYARKTSRI